MPSLIGGFGRAAQSRGGPWTGRRTENVSSSPAGALAGTGADVRQKRWPRPIDCGLPEDGVRNPSPRLGRVVILLLTEPAQRSNGWIANRWCRSKQRGGHPQGALGRKVFDSNRLRVCMSAVTNVPGVSKNMPTTCTSLPSFHISNPCQRHVGGAGS